MGFISGFKVLRRNDCATVICFRTYLGLITLFAGHTRCRVFYRWNLLPSVWVGKLTKLGDAVCREFLRDSRRYCCNRRKLESGKPCPIKDHWSYCLWKNSRHHCKFICFCPICETHSGLLQWSRVSLRIEWFPRICGHHDRSNSTHVIPLSLATLRNEYSVTRNTQLTNWKRISQNIRQFDSTLLRHVIDKHARHIKTRMMENGVHCQHIRRCQFDQHESRYVFYGITTYCLLLSSHYVHTRVSFFMNHTFFR